VCLSVDVGGQICVCLCVNLSVLVRVRACMRVPCMCHSSPCHSSPHSSLLPHLLPSLTTCSTSQAEGPTPMTFKLLGNLLPCGPHCVPAAIKANVVRGLVHVLRQRCPRPKSQSRRPADIWSELETPLWCLVEIACRDSAFWKPAIKAGTVPVMVDALALRHEPVVRQVLHLAKLLLAAAPRQDGGQWAGKLPRAIGRLIRKQPPVAPGTAADILFKMASAHRELLEDYSKWGMGRSLEGLMDDSDSETCEAAARLHGFLVAESLLVGWSPEPHMSSCACFLTESLPILLDCLLSSPVSYSTLCPGSRCTVLPARRWWVGHCCWVGPLLDLN
jgi:hypothetical protein